MRFKTYAGRSLADLVPQIRADLGPDAVILKQRTTRSGGVGGFFAQRGVEILAADRAPGPGEPTSRAFTPPTSPSAPDRRADPRPVAPVTPTPVPPRLDVADGEVDSTQQLLRDTFAGALNARLEREGRPEADHEAGTPGTEAPQGVRAMPRGRADDPAATALGTPVAPVDEAPPGGLPPAAAPPPVPSAPVGPDPRPSWLAQPPTPARAAAAPRPVTAARAEPGWTPDEEAADLLLELERSGVSADVAADLVRDVCLHVLPFGGGRLRERTRARIAGRIRVEQGWAPDGSARRIALVGASGVGKTSAAAKLAAAWTTAGLRVGLVVVDPLGDEQHPLAARLGSEADRLLSYAAGSDVLRVQRPEEASRVQARLAARDVVLVDTPGVSPADAARTEGVRAVLEAVAPHETHLVLPLGLAPRETAAALSRFGRLGADRLLVTKTDEARFAGPFLDLAARFDVPLSYVGEGPRVPGDLRAADGGFIAARILPI